MLPAKRAWRRWAGARVTTTEALQAKIGTLSLEAQEKLEKDTAKKEAKAEAKADAALKKKMVRPSPSIHWDGMRVLTSNWTCRRHHKCARTESQARTYG